MTTTFNSRAERRAYMTAAARVAKKQARKQFAGKTAATFGIATILITSAGFTPAMAAENTETSYPTFAVSAENQSIINRATADMNSSNSKVFWTGQVDEISISDADRAYLASLGITLDSAASVALTNARNADETPGIWTSFAFDDATLAANRPEVAASLDASASPEGAYSGVGLLVGAPDTLYANITSQAVTPKPVYPQNVPLSSPARYLDATRNDPNRMLADAGAFPTSSLYAGGKDSGNGTSQNIDTAFVDAFANSGAARIADTNSNGQRGLNPATTVNCVVESICGFWVTPAYSGAVGNLPNATIAIGEPVWVSVKTSYAVAAIPEWTKENPFVDADGNKFWFTPKPANLALSPEFDAGVAFANWEHDGQTAIDLADAQERKITTTVSYDGTALNAQFDLKSGTVSTMTSVVSDGADAQEKVLTITAQNPQEGEDWFLNNDLIAPFFVGQTFTQDAPNGETVRFTVTAMDVGQIVFTVNSESTPVTINAAQAVIGTSVSTYGVSQSRVVVPTYEVHYLKAETPPVIPEPEPEPEIPVIPTPEPDPEIPVIPEPEPDPEIPTPDLTTIPETPTPELTTIPETPTPDLTTIPVVPQGDGSDEEVIPQGDGSDELADTGAEGDVLLGMGLLGGGLGVAGGIVLYVAKARRGKHA